MAPKPSPLFLWMLLFLFFFLTSSHETSAYGEKEKPSPFSFIRDLRGCSKGEKVAGIRKLKKYLEKFGYLSYNSHSRGQISTGDDDYFDDPLQSAIKSYQTNYHLKATGNLDSQTVTEMMRPRCGVPDIINGTNWMQSSQKRDNHRHGSLHTPYHYDFFPESPRWAASNVHLTYAFLPGFPDNAKIPVSQAFDKWASATNFTFAETQDFRNANLTVGFFMLFHGDGNPFDGPGGTIAHAYAPRDGRLHYDAHEPWAVGAVPGAMDLESVALHEIGHLLGLGHSSVRDAIMFPSISSGVTKGLHADDIEGITALYKA